jgi:beta-glucanase (GH16 family)
VAPFIRGCFVSLLLSLSVQNVFAQKPKQDDWRLVWHDEFNGRKLDPKKWNVLTREQSKHNELQYYLPDEVYLENGRLRTI